MGLNIIRKRVAGYPPRRWKELEKSKDDYRRGRRREREKGGGKEGERGETKKLPKYP